MEESDLTALRRIVKDGLVLVASRLCPEELEQGRPLRHLGLWGFYLATVAQDDSDPTMRDMRRELTAWSDTIAGNGVLAGTEGERLPAMNLTHEVVVDLKPLLEAAARADAKEASARVWGYVGSLVQRFASTEEGRTRGQECCARITAFLDTAATAAGGGLGAGAAGTGNGDQNAKAFLGQLVGHLVPQAAACGTTNPLEVRNTLMQSGQLNHLFGALMGGIETGAVDMPTLLRAAADMMQNPAAVAELVSQHTQAPR